MVFGFIVIFSTISMLLLVETSFSSEFEVVTETPFKQKMPLLISFLTGLTGVYVAVVKLWRNLDSKENTIFLTSSSAVLVVSVVILLSWISSVHDSVVKTYQNITYPSDVDQISTSVQLSLLDSISLMFAFFGIIGLASIIVSLIHLKRLSKLN
ncbi:MAG: hypothetical protein CMP61_12150 [Flavobacteriales bacterium]|nr:hypothetical protein [Flavobacteriales bacterium]|tara:strand:- start:3555 stop:4016 length:462 start_codon:yes stop_codon:yes gene_type:complete